MIRLQDLTPEIYYKQSRDFQFIGRLYDIVLNSIKTNSDLLYSLPISKNSDTQLIDLMTMTLGFKSKHNYNVQQLTALCSAFVPVIKSKGSMQAIDLAVNALLNAEGITDKFTWNISDDKLSINLFVPEKLSDLNLLYDLLDYILPAGMICNIYRNFAIIEDAATAIDAGTHNIKYKWSDEDKAERQINNKFAAIEDITNAAYLADINNPDAKNTKGIISNNMVYKPGEPEEA